MKFCCYLLHYALFEKKLLTPANLNYVNIIVSSLMIAFYFIQRGSISIPSTTYEQAIYVDPYYIIILCIYGIVNFKFDDYSMVL